MRVVQHLFSNSLIIYAEHLILVRWMGLETQWKTSWKPRPCLEIISNADANFPNLHIDKARKTHDDRQLYLITHFTKKKNFNPKLFTADVKYNGTVIKLPKNGKGHSFSKFKFSLNGGDLVFWFAFNLAVHFRPKMALRLEIPSSSWHFLFT